MTIGNKAMDHARVTRKVDRRKGSGRQVQNYIESIHKWVANKTIDYSNFMHARDGKMGWRSMVTDVCSR